MRPVERQARIIDLVRTRGKVRVDELVRDFSISAETIRRDLTLLATTGKIQKRQIREMVVAEAAKAAKAAAAK